MRNYQMKKMNLDKNAKYICYKIYLHGRHTFCICLLFPPQLKFELSNRPKIIFCTGKNFNHIVLSH